MRGLLITYRLDAVLSGSLNFDNGDLDKIFKDEYCFFCFLRHLPRSSLRLQEKTISLSGLTKLFLTHILSSETS